MRIYSLLFVIYVTAVIFNVRDDGWFFWVVFIAYALAQLLTSWVNTIERMNNAR